ncbi:MAG: hypothetical protein AAF823_01005 [Planctomycetota bacterium]
MIDRTRPVDLPPPTATGEDEWALLAADANRRLSSLLRSQVNDGGLDDGGFRESPRRLPDGREAAYRAAELIALRIFSDRLGLQAAKGTIEDAIRRALRFVASRQRHDGQLDLAGSYSPNEAGFVIPGLVMGRRALQAADPRLFEELSARIETIVRGAADAVVAGDAFTANHRWAAACAPLAIAHNAFPDPRYPAKIESYLADGVDCDDDGFWYEERSPNYNDVSNDSMLILADELGREEFLDHAIRNLYLMLEMTQPDGSADTSTSFRQDRHGTGRSPARYRAARRAAIHTGDGRFTTFARRLISNDGLGRLTHLLYDLDAHPGPLPAAEPMPSRLHRHFPTRQIVRHRHDAWAVTLAADAGGHYFDTVAPPGPSTTGRSTDWLCIHAGKVKVPTIRLAIAGAGVFAPSTLRRLGSRRYRLTDNRSGFILRQHFRPGRPSIGRDLPMCVMAELTTDNDHATLDLDIKATSSVFASLAIYVDVHSSVNGDVIGVGEAIERPGDGSVSLCSSHDRMVIEGLPPSLHDQALAARPHIPDQLDTNAGQLLVGLRLPTRLSLIFRHESANRKSQVLSL